MRKTKRLSIVFNATLLLVLFVSVQTKLAADSGKVEGLIKARNGDTMPIQSSSGEQVTVLLTDNTQVKQKEGMLQVRRKEMAMAALIPGLEVQVEGTYDDQNRLTAKSVTFKGNDLERAQAIQAGMHETQVQSQQNKENIEKQSSELQAQKSAIDAAAARFGQLDDYWGFRGMVISDSGRS
jgi:OmpA-OmpF porin, OOP family